MPVTAEKIIGEPIIIVTYSGQVTVRDVVRLVEYVSKLIPAHRPPLYRLTRMESDRVALSFDVFKQMTVIEASRHSGAITDTDVKTLLIGDHPFLFLLADAMSQEAFGAVELPLFETLDDALSYVLQMRSATSGSA